MLEHSTQAGPHLRGPPPGFETVRPSQPQQPQQHHLLQQHLQYQQPQQQADLLPGLVPPAGLRDVAAMRHALLHLGWVRRPPPVLASAAAEWQWMSSGPECCLQWDSSMTQDDGSTQVLVQGLINKAVAGPLLPAQQSAVLAHLDADPALVHDVNLQPEQLPALVEHNPVLAHEVLVRLLRSRRMPAFLQVLARMQLSLHSMEVVNRLTASTQLPPDFMALYVSNCINACDTIQDKFLQNRLVRLVCVFLQSLIRNRTITLNGLLLEVQAFCVKFSRIREAASLFRVLKQMELGGSLTSLTSSPVAT